MRILKYLLMLSLVFVFSCKDDPVDNEDACTKAGQDPNEELAILEAMRNNEAAGVLKVMTRNIYIGADVDVVLEAEDFTDIPVLVAAAYATVQKTDFNKRAELLAAEIALAEPHVIGLQEVSQFYRQSPGDFIDESGLPNPEQTPATDLEWDYLTILMNALDAKGLDYEVAHEIENANIELPMFTGVDGDGNVLLDDMRIVDRDVLLVRSDVQASKKMKGNYQANLPVEPDLGLIIPRGYVSAEIAVGGKSYRIVNTHLEAASVEVEGVQLRAIQATELISIYQDESLPVIFLGDYNSPATSGQAYNLILNAGYKDAWSNNTETYSYNAPGNTYGHYGGEYGDLSSESVNMFQRIDFAFVRSSTDPTWGPVVVVGDEVCERDYGLWASDHGGLIAQLTF
jgi:endonuclease/exonuclease/phosphatase family metal-dependent hydrolase